MTASFSLDPTTAAAVLERLVQRGDARAPLPVLPDDVNLVAAQDALRAMPLLELADAMRHARARRLAADVAPALGRVVGALGLAESALRHALAEVLARPYAEIVAACVRGPRASEPRAFAKHAYLGAFETKGRFVIADFCYLDKRERLLSASVRARPGRYHAWIEWTADQPDPRRLIVAHHDAIDLAGSPSTELASLGNDAGMIGVFDGQAAQDADFRGWLRTQAEWAAPIVGIADGRGVLVGTAGDGVWPVRARFDGDDAIVVKVALAYDVDLDAPLVPAGASLPTESRPYSPKTRFSEGELVVHPKFGQGRVTQASRDNAVIAFGDGPRTLVHGRG